MPVHLLMTNRSHSLDSGSQGIGQPPLDTTLALLSDSHRRRVITELVEDNPRTVEEFVDTAAQSDPRALKIALTHTHLPKLQEAGVIEWETDTGAVRRGPQFDAVEVIVGLLRSNQDVLPADWP